MAVFKTLGGGNHIVEPFEVNASHSFVWTSGSTNFDGFSINLANQPPVGYPVGYLGRDTTHHMGGSTEGGFYSYPVYHSIKNYFYLDADGLGSASVADVYEYFPSGSMFVWSIGSNYIGEGIKPDTFKIQIDGNSDNIQDDGNAKLRINKTGSVVGNIFYNQGIAVVQRNITASVDALSDEGTFDSTISTDGLSISASAILTSSFQSMIDIYEHRITCRIEPSDYNVTFNPTTFQKFKLGDYSPSSGSYLTPITASSDSYSDYIVSGSALPYITTIGLYNDSNEMLAVAKLSKPITRMKHSDQIFVIKFDE